MTEETAEPDEPEFVEMPDEEICAKLDELTREFCTMIDGELTVLVGAAMGRALGETIQDQTALRGALATLMLNAYKGHSELMAHLTSGQQDNVTKH